MFKKRRHEPEPVEVLEPEPEVEQAHATELRTLRAQVRVLEQALERIVEPPDLESYRTQVRVAVQAVALGTTAEGDPRAAVARVAAAIARIDAPATGRTLLPAPVTVARPAVEPAPAPVESETAPVAEAGAEPEVVLPVPPPAPVEHGRTRRRRSRTAA